MTSFIFRTESLARAGIVAFAVCSSLVAYSAAAEPAVKQQIVSFDDLDLSKPAGAQTLYKRIKAAARQVCGPVDRYAYTLSPQSFRECYEKAIADAVAQVDRPSLTALHRDQTRSAAG